MQNKNKLKNLGFTSGHAQVLTVAVAVFAFLIIAKTDLNLRALFANADDKKTITYEELLNQVKSEYGEVPQSDYSEAQQQIALLERSEDGQVLGEAIGLGTIPSAEQMYSDENLATIPIAKIIPTNETTVNVYFSNIKLVETHYDAAALFGNLNSTDSSTLKQAQTTALNIANEMKAMEVPSDLVRFHKYTILYYASISIIGQGFAENNFGQGFKEASKSMLSLTDKLTAMKQEYAIQYNILF